MTGSNHVEDLLDRVIWAHEGGPEQEPGQWEVIAGAVTSALVDGREQPPSDLLRRVRSDALGFFGRDRANRETIRRARLLAAAALVLTASVAFCLWLASPPRAPTASGRLASLVRLEPDDLIRVDWRPGPSELRGDIRGEVVWSDARQEGYMSFRGLPANDPTDRQYQLWIFDALRSEAYPVDGGVFDIASASEELVVPIRAKIRVHMASVFAVTLEEPGGVVVSDREHIVALASL